MLFYIYARVRVRVLLSLSFFLISSFPLLLSSLNPVIRKTCIQDWVIIHHHPFFLFLTLFVLCAITKYSNGCTIHSGSRQIVLNYGKESVYIEISTDSVFVIW